MNMLVTNLARATSLSRQLPPLTSTFANAALASTCTTSATTSSSFRHNYRAYHTTSPSLLASSNGSDWHGTTIVCVRKNGRVCMMGDGMVSMGSVIVKPNAKKIRRIYPKSMGADSSSASSTSSSSSTAGEDAEDSKSDDGTIVGFAGTTADAFTLLERLEGKLDEHPGQLARSCVELAKGWRTDKYLRRLEASLLVADKKAMFNITGNGDVLESHDGVLGVGSGSMFAIAAARAQMDNPDLSAEDVARKAMEVASEMCIYTNNQFMMESLKMEEESKEGGDEGKE